MSNYPPGVTDAEIDTHHGEQPPDPDSREAEWVRDLLEVRDKLVILKHREGGSPFLAAKALESFDKFTTKWSPFQ